MGTRGKKNTSLISFLILRYAPPAIGVFGVSEAVAHEDHLSAGCIQRALFFDNNDSVVFHGEEIQQRAKRGGNIAQPLGVTFFRKCAAHRDSVSSFFICRVRFVTAPYPKLFGLA